MLRKSAVFAFSVLISVSAFGQSSTQWKTKADVVEGVRGTMVGTVSDLQPGQNRFTLTPDDDTTGFVTVETDAVSTQYNGFGGTINGAPEIFVGSTGFSNLRVGDRVEVRGVGRNAGVIGGDYITLLGRPVPASQTGVGQTRTPQSISPPTVSGTTPTPPQPQATGPVEGVVRQVNASDGRIVIETDRRNMVTIRGTSSTPVYYRNNVYRIGNLEPGDRIRVQAEGSSSIGGEIRARTIDVVQNVEESGGATVQVGGLTGRVMSIDRRANSVRVQNDRGETAVVDLTNALDTSGRRIRAADMQVGDQVDLSGSYVGDVFVASTVRFMDENTVPSPGTATTPYPAAPSPLGAVTIYGTVTQTLANAPRMVVRDQAGGTILLYVLEDFAVRTRAGGYTTADRLREGDSIVVKAYRDSDGNYIAQTIRLR